MKIRIYINEKEKKAILDWDKCPDSLTEKIRLSQEKGKKIITNKRLSIELKQYDKTLGIIGWNPSAIREFLRNENGTFTIDDFNDLYSISESIPGNWYATIDGKTDKDDLTLRFFTFIKSLPDSKILTF